MPVRAARICGCGKRVPSNMKCECDIRRDAERKARFDEKRPTATQRGYGGKWQKARAEFLAANPVCTRVKDNGKICGAPATVVHHSVPHRGDMRIFWKRSLWKPRCGPCHDIFEQSNEKRASS